MRIPAAIGWTFSGTPDSDVVLSTRVRLARNFETFPFPKAAHLYIKSQVFARIADVFNTPDLLPGYEVFNFNNLDRLSQEIFVEERAVSPDLVRMEGDRGLMCDSTRTRCIMVNEEDHLRIQCISSGNCTQELFAMANQLDTILGEKIPFAFDARRGFLTACPSNVGTGLRLSFLLHLPALIITKAIDKVLNAVQQMSLCTRGFCGENSEIVGSFFQISNQQTLGQSEAEIIEKTQGAIAEIIRSERTARETILHQAKSAITDKIARAEGILRFAHTLSMREYLNLNSALRMGVNYNIVTTRTVEEMNIELLHAMPGHIQKNVGKSLTEDEINRERALLIQSLFHDHDQKIGKTL